MERWRLLDTGLLPAAENMCLDDVILKAKSNNLVPNTLRFLMFSPPAVLVGFHQSVEQEVRLEYCKPNGIDVNRRLTGGGAILFTPTQIGWEIYAELNNPKIPRRVEDIYRKLCEGAIAGLRKLGIKAEFRPRNDIEVNGRKISGTGGTSRGNAFMFQGTLLIDFDVEMMIKSLRIPIKKLKDKELESIRDRVTTIKQELGYVPSVDRIKKVIQEGFEESLGIELERGSLTEYESNLFNKRLPFFKSWEWIYGLRRQESQGGEVYGFKRAKGGLIKTSLAIDLDRGVIESTLITGDFFLYPNTAIYDLEALLKHVRLDLDELKKIVLNFFRKNKVQMPGVKPLDFFRALEDAVNKVSYTKWGFTLDESNELFMVNTSFEEFIRNGAEILLLPYCAKKLDCRFRKCEGCNMCGLCTIGEAYRLAYENNLTPLTIVSYEHLEEVLAELEKKKVKGYIGCCCEAFYTKHQRDFEKFNVPGLLINIKQTTCYDLGLEQVAYRGDFENQTDLDLQLLNKVLDIIKKYRSEIHESVKSE
ncbi:MAG: lipoate--protein ligase family protein [Candidatus Odinarchaeia archaeon]